jgi:hypothetical protein
MADLLVSVSGMVRGYVSYAIERHFEKVRNGDEKYDTRKPENVVTSLSRLDIIVLATRMQDLCNDLKS